jgi:hypothetical protein
MFKSVYRQTGIPSIDSDPCHKPRVLFFQPDANPPGGGKAVTAWMLEALKESFEIHLLSWRPPDLASINRYYGTSLKAGDFISISVPRF